MQYVRLAGSRQMSGSAKSEAESVASLKVCVCVSMGSMRTLACICVKKLLLGVDSHGIDEIAFWVGLHSCPENQKRRTCYRALPPARVVSLQVS